MHVKSFDCLVSVAALVISTVLATGLSWAEGVVLPEFRALGKSPGAVSLFARPTAENGSTEQKYPQHVSLDIYGERIEGVVAVYSDDVALHTVVDLVGSKERNSQTYPQLVEHGIWMWRNEKQRYGVQVVRSEADGLGPRLVALCLHRKGSPGVGPVLMSHSLVKEARALVEEANDALSDEQLDEDELE